MARFTLPGAAHLILYKDDKVLLLRRYQTGWMDGYYALPAGHIDGNETFSTAMIREANEEIGVTIAPQDLEFVNMTHHFSDKEYVYVVFTAKKWEGEPKNMEPNKCDDLQWFPVDDLPDNITEGAASAVRNLREGKPYDEMGWEDAPAAEAAA